MFTDAMMGILVTPWRSATAADYATAPEDRAIEKAASAWLAKETPKVKTTKSILLK